MPFLRLSALWIQITGTWCNLQCTHCINASGPDDPWLKPIAPEVARGAMTVAHIVRDPAHPAMRATAIPPEIAAKIDVAPAPLGEGGIRRHVHTKDRPQD